MIGKLVGHYRIIEKIGAGGMGEIFRARDERLERDVALKLIGPSSSDNPDHIRRFEQEARAAAALNHPNIVAIYDVGLDGTTPYMVSELLEGMDLRKRLLEGPIPAREAANYSLQIVQGLITAHEHHIVHRDLKPENLFLTNDGRIKILDFGVAKLQAPIEGKRDVEKLTTVTKSGTVVGTVAYMSPEQLRAKAVDHRSDLFSMGAILYEMLAGHRAFRGETEVDTMTAVLREEPPQASLEQAAIPIGYREIIKHCLEKDPENRFQSAKDLGFSLQTLLGSPDGTTLIPGPMAKSSRAVSWALCSVLALATLLLGIEQLRVPASLPRYERISFESGTIYSARFASDGKTIVYGSAWNNRPLQLFTTVGNSFQIQPLTLPEASLLAISGKNNVALATHGTHTGQLEIAGGMLALAPLAGGSPHERTSDVRWADYAPGKEDLAVVHYVGNHSRLEYPEEKVLYQTEGWISHIRFSPQGDKLAFMNHPMLWDNKGEVCVTDLSGHMTTLTGMWASEQGLAWRPDGKEIWFSAVDKGNNLNLMAVDLSGKLRTLLTSPVGIAVQDIGADGRVLATAITTKRLDMALSVRGIQEDAVLSWHDWNVVKDISRDGRSVLFEDASESAGSKYAVALRELDKTLPSQLGEGGGGGLSPDGKWAVAISLGEPDQVTLLPTGLGQPRSINTGGLQHVQTGWARFLDNDRLIVNGNETGHATRCYILQLNGAGKATPITPDGIFCGPPSPDNRYVAATTLNATLALYPVENGSPRPIPASDAKFRPVQWSADNSLLYGYRSGEFPSKIYKLEIASGRETVIQELHPAAPAGIVLVAPIVVSRDGTRAAYSYSQILSTLYVISGLH
jgi:eukaryotic-like serine/threonine-protein kinase